MVESIRFTSNTQLQDQYTESWGRMQQVNKTAEQLQSYWVGFITICAFIVASAMSVTHSDIFLENPLQLPVISVDLPLYWFFLVSPVLIFLLHVFLLVKYRFLLETLEWLRELEQKPDINLENAATNLHPSQLEEHLSNTILMRSIDTKARDIKGSEITANRFSKFFSPILNFSLTLLPVVLLLVLQGKILPYQVTSLEITYKLIVVFEAIVVFWAFKEYWMKAGERFWWLLFVMGASVIISLHFMSSSPERIAAGEWDSGYHLWSPILSPDNRDFVEDQLLDRDDGRGTKHLQKRSFVGAMLEYADLRGINLSNSDFRHSKLLRARFDGATVKGSDFSFADLQGASFTTAAMDDVKIWGANLDVANFSGADLKRAEFHGSNLEHALFDGSNMKKTRFVGSNLRHTRLIGANLKDAVFIASYIGQANFSGAELKRAFFTGVMFNGPQLLETIGIETCRKPPKKGDNAAVNSPTKSKTTPSPESKKEPASVNEVKSIVALCPDENEQIKIITPNDTDNDTDIEIRANALILRANSDGKEIGTKRALFDLYTKQFKENNRNEKLRYDTFAKIRENDWDDLWDIKIEQQHCVTPTLKDGGYNNIRHLLYDRMPNFDAARLDDASFDGQVIEKPDVKNALFGKRKTELVPKYKAESTRSFLKKPPAHWGKAKLSDSDAYKLQLSGCREEVASRLPELNPEAPPKMYPFIEDVKEDVNDGETLETIMCTAGTYPHVANTITLSGRLRISGKKGKTPYIKLAQKIILNRCESPCPGANKMHSDAIGELWNIAHYNGGKFIANLPYQTNGVPEVVTQCELWKEFSPEIISE